MKKEVTKVLETWRTANWRTNLLTKVD